MDVESCYEKFLVAARRLAHQELFMVWSVPQGYELLRWIFPGASLFLVAVDSAAKDQVIFFLIICQLGEHLISSGVVPLIIHPAFALTVGILNNLFVELLAVGILH